MITDKGTVGSERSDQDKLGGIQLDVQVCEEEIIQGKMEPERRKLKPSPAGTGVEAPGQPRLSCRQMQRTTVGGCRHAYSRLGQRIIIFQIIVGVKPDKQALLCGASCKIVISPLMGWQQGEGESDNEQLIQFDHSG